MDPLTVGGLRREAKFVTPIGCDLPEKKGKIEMQHARDTSLVRHVQGSTLTEMIAD